MVEEPGSEGSVRVIFNGVGGGQMGFQEVGVNGATVVASMPHDFDQFAKTIKVCATEDPVCSDGMNFAAHNTYADDGAVIDKGVAFAYSHLGTGGPATMASSGGFGG